MKPTQNQRFKHKTTGEVLTFKKLVPVFNGLGIDHYIFSKQNRDIAIPIGEWTRTKNEYELLTQ